MSPSSAADDACRDLEVWNRIAANHPLDKPDESFLDDFLIISFTVLFLIALVCGLALAVVTAYRLIADGVGGPAAVMLLVLLTGVGVAVVRGIKSCKGGHDHD